MPSIPPVIPLGIGPVQTSAIMPAFNFASNPPAYPSIPPVQPRGLGPVYVDPNAGRPS